MWTMFSKLFLLRKRSKNRLFDISHVLRSRRISFRTNIKRW
jgi:hypothetical protein